MGNQLEKVLDNPENEQMMIKIFQKYDTDGSNALDKEE